MAFSQSPDSDFISNSNSDCCTNTFQWKIAASVQESMGKQSECEKAISTRYCLWNFLWFTEILPLKFPLIHCTVCFAGIGNITLQQRGMSNPPFQRNITPTSIAPNFGGIPGIPPQQTSPNRCVRTLSFTVTLLCGHLLFTFGAASQQAKSGSKALRINNRHQRKCMYRY